MPSNDVRVPFGKPVGACAGRRANPGHSMRSARKGIEFPGAEYECLARRQIGVELRTPIVSRSAPQPEVPAAVRERAGPRPPTPIHELARADIANRQNDRGAIPAEFVVPNRMFI